MAGLARDRLLGGEGGLDDLDREGALRFVRVLTGPAATAASSTRQAPQAPRSSIEKTRLPLTVGRTIPVDGGVPGAHVVEFGGPSNVTRGGEAEMVRSAAERAFLPARNVIEEIGDMMILTGRTIVSALRPPYPYGGEFVSQFLFALRSVLVAAADLDGRDQLRRAGPAGGELPDDLRRARSSRRVLRARGGARNRPR